MAITRTEYMSTANLGNKTTAHTFNRIFPVNMPTLTRGRAMRRKEWEKRVASCLLKAARIYQSVYEYDYGHPSKASGAEDYVPEGWDTSKAFAKRGCDLAVEDHVFDLITSIAFEAVVDTGWMRDEEGAERWARVLHYQGQDRVWLHHEAERLLYRGPGFWSNTPQFETREDGTTVVTLVSHNEGE